MESIKQSCTTLLRDCQNNGIYHSQSRLRPAHPMSRLRDKLTASSMFKWVSPQEEQQNNRIIEKLRRGYRKKEKERSIKKTSLGQDLETFTQQQFEKLQFIDECQQRNIAYHEISEEQPSIDNRQRMTAIDRLKKMANINDIIDEVRGNLEWGDAKQAKQGRHYLKYKQSKVFTRRANNKRGTLVVRRWEGSGEEGVIQGKISIQKYYHTLLNKNSFNRNFLNSTTAVVGKSREGGLSFQEKLELIKEEANKNLARICATHHIYMTEERKNALYQCQLLRISKKVLAPKEVEKLQLSLNQREAEVEEAEERQSRSAEKESKNCEAEEILEKNYKRIKQQRKRVIQKLLC